MSGCAPPGDGPAQPDESVSRFRYIEIDSAGPNAPWGKGIGDIDGDGWIDVIVGGHRLPRPTFGQRSAR